MPGLFSREIYFPHIFSLKSMAAKCTHFPIRIPFPASGKYREVRLPSLKAKENTGLAPVQENP